CATPASPLRAPLLPGCGRGTPRDNAQGGRVGQGFQTEIWPLRVRCYTARLAQQRHHAPHISGSVPGGSTESFGYRFPRGGVNRVLSATVFLSRRGAPRVEDDRDEAKVLRPRMQ